MQLGPWLQAEAAADRFSGAVIVARGDTVLHRAAYGPADRARGAPLTPEHRFRLASLSKQFTAAAVLRLQDQGVLGVDDPLCKWVQPCPEAWRPITLHHLLTHQSGVPDLMTRRDWSKLRFREWTPARLAQAAVSGVDARRTGRRLRPAAARLRAGHGRSLQQRRLQPAGLGGGEGFGPTLRGAASP
jgi:CubicO group peptidase (beta-lactamase class C family)